jgi:signal transduction histidine kinase
VGAGRRGSARAALINLLKNAVEAAGETGGEVSIGWEEAPGEVELVVSDEGPGLLDSRNLFVPFYTTKPEGSGIGLVLCRQIAEAHRGTLSCGTPRGGAGVMRGSGSRGWRRRSRRRRFRRREELSDGFETSGFGPASGRRNWDCLEGTPTAGERLRRRVRTGNLLPGIGTTPRDGSNRSGGWRRPAACSTMGLAHG